MLLPRFCSVQPNASALGSVVTNTRNPSAASSEAKAAQSPFASVNPCWSQISPRGSPAGRYQSVGTRCVRKAQRTAVAVVTLPGGATMIGIVFRTGNDAGSTPVPDLSGIDDSSR